MHSDVSNTLTEEKEEEQRSPAKSKTQKNIKLKQLRKEESSQRMYLLTLVNSQRRKNSWIGRACD